MAPLPPASPQSPSAPLPTAASPSSSLPNLDASNLPGYPDIDHSSNKLPFTELRALDSFDKVTASNQFKHITSVREGSQNFEGGSECEAGSLARDGVSSTGTVILDFSSPPPKPSDDKVVHKIDSFCQLIAMNGPGIEDITRQNESRNPDFEFLFGGEPGSVAAVAHEYFLWMKKKCILACKLDERKIESPLKSLGIDSSSQPDHFIVSSGCSLPADSDMEMEDDITLSDGDQEVHDSTDALNRNSDVIHGELDVKKHLHRAQSSPGWTAPQGVSCEKVSSSLSSELCKQSEGTNRLLDQCQLIIEKAPSGVDIYSTGASESPLASEREKSSIPIADDPNTLGASVAAEAINSDGVSNQSITVNSPFRLLQDYASENSSENDLDAFFEDVNVVIAPSSVTTSVKSSHKDAGSHFEIGSESLCMTDKMSGMQYESRRSKFSLDTKKEVKGTSTTLTIESHEASQGKDASNGAPIDIVSKRNKFQGGKKTKSESVLPKVDEYGRLVREGSSDSSSDGSRYNKRHSKRGRSRSRGRIRSRSRSHSRSRIRSRSRSRSRTRSRSRSPLDSRRRRRSPQRRREKRNRSPSWSSRNQRSRSRSPTFRRAGEFRDENKRQDRHHIPECFDFRRGKCYRGASCRYMHREHDKNDGSWRHKSKQKHLEFQPSLKDSRIKEEIEDSSDMNLHDEIKGQDMQLCQDVATKDGQFIDPDKTDCESSRVAAATMQVKQILQVKLEETIAHNPDEREVLESHYPSSQMMSCADNMKSCGHTSQAIEQSRSNNSARQLRKADFPSQQMEVSPLSDSSPDRPFKTSPNKISSIEPSPSAILSTHSRHIECSNAQPISSGQFSSKFMAPKESPLPSFSANSSYPLQLPLPPPPPPSLSQGTSAAHVPQSHRDYNQMPPYPVQSIPTGIMHSYQGPLPNQHAQFSVSQDSPWTSLPPPPPRPLYDSSLNAGTAARGASSQFQQNHLAPRSDFGSQSSMRPYGPYPTELPHSKGEFLHQMYPTLSELPHPLPNREDFGSGNPSNQPFGGLGLMREDRFTHAPVKDVNSSHSFAHGHTHPQPAPSSQDLTMIKMQNFSGDNFPSGELSNSSSQIHPHSQNQQPSSGVQYSVGDSILGVPGKTGVQYPVGGSILGLPGKDGPMSRYPPDILDRSQFSGVPDFGPSRIQTHHNPYAATFEQPLSSKFSSNILIQEKNAPGLNMFDTLVHAPVDGQGVGSSGSRQTTSSPSSARAVGQLLPKADSEQYDPLFDSIEPSSNPLNKNNHSQKHIPTSDSNTMVRLSGSCEPLDVEENNKHTEVGPVASATSMDNDGYGETADAEVGVVEDESLSDDDGAANMAAGEIEIDQVKSTGKSKKKKDSRSTRLFKSAIADFVKDLLKPSWRQGNMSKEAFKTIVKKTVDKVSGAMKSHQIPKSQEKIDRYIDSSQRKLTKLVMGYVDKYVKV